MDGMAMVPKVLRISSTDGTTIPLPFYPYASLLIPTNVEFQLMSSLNVTVFLLI